MDIKEEPVDNSFAAYPPPAKVKKEAVTIGVQVLYYYHVSLTWPVYPLTAKAKQRRLLKVIRKFF